MMKITSRKKEVLFLAIALILQTVIFVFAGMSKSYIHMDEAYSFGLTTYDKVEISDNEDFYDTWHEGTYYMDYLVLDEDEAGDWRAVYENQRDDVHPPLYYLLLRFAMSFSVGEYSVWPGMILNMIIYLFITVVTYLIFLKLFKGHDRYKEKSLVFAFMSSVSLASVTSAVYIRMYALATLWVLLTVYLHILLVEKHFSYKLMLPIGLVALAGSLTHYYYLFFLVMTCIIAFVGYARRREWKYAAVYTAVLLLAAAVSLAIFPYSIEHMFFGYRGEGAISKLSDPGLYFMGLGLYLVLASYSMNHLFIPLAVCLIIGGCVLAYKLCYLKDKTPAPETLRSRKKAPMLRMIYLPTLFYFILVSIASPWDALRYIMPVCALIFILVIYGLYWVVCRITDEKLGERVLALSLALMIAAPVVFFAKPQEIFMEKRELVQMIEGERNVPAVYFYDTDYDRFLDDILLFAKLDESYVAKDVISHDKGQDMGTVKEIFEGKDTSQGIIVFINGEQLHWVIIDSVRQALGLHNCEKLATLNACDVYYIN